MRLEVSRNEVSRNTMNIIPHGDHFEELNGLTFRGFTLHQYHDPWSGNWPRAISTQNQLESIAHERRNGGHRKEQTAHLARLLDQQRDGAVTAGLGLR